MTYQITIHHSDKSPTHMQVEADTTVLEAMHDQQLPVRKACRNGACGVCRCRLVSREVDYGQRFPHGLWQKDI